MVEAGDYQAHSGNGRGSNGSNNSFQNQSGSFGGGGGSTGFDSSSIGEGFSNSGANEGEDGNEDGNDGGNGEGGSSKKKKANPLVDLIETETAYVAELGKIIKVSAVPPSKWEKRKGTTSHR